jgi:hypothetical protein
MDLLSYFNMDSLNRLKESALSLPTGFAAIFLVCFFMFSFFGRFSASWVARQAPQKQCNKSTAMVSSTSSQGTKRSNRRRKED